MRLRVVAILVFFGLSARPPLSAQEPKLRATIGTGHSASVHCVALSPDFKMFASASGDTTVKLWETATGKELATLKGHSFPVVVVAFSPDGKFLYSRSDRSDARIWQVATRQAIAADDLTFAAASGWHRPARTRDDGRAPAKIATKIKGKFDLVRPSPDGKTVATVDSYILTGR